MTWLPYALLSAAAAAATAILAKVGIQGVPSNLATAIRTVVILIFAWAIVLGQGLRRLKALPAESGAELWPNHDLAHWRALVARGWPTLAARPW